MKLFLQPQSYIPNPTGPSGCDNKWCADQYINFPATGEFPEIASCSSYNNMIRTQMQSGGISGRGVTPCPYGIVDRTPPGTNGSLSALYPFNPTNVNDLSGQSMLFDPSRPSYLPPTGNIRSLMRIGNQWKN